MKAGLVIYAASIHRLAGFYTHVFGLETLESDDTYALLTAGDFELVLLETAVSRTVPDAPEARTNTAIKPTFFIDGPLELIGEKIRAKGGVLYSPKNWAFGGHQVCDGHDCEGNIFQLRIRKSA